MCVCSLLSFAVGYAPPPLSPVRCDNATAKVFRLLFYVPCDDASAKGGCCLLFYVRCDNASAKEYRLLFYVRCDDARIKIFRPLFYVRCDDASAKGGCCLLFYALSDAV